ncbi:spore coat protein [Alkaliphilus peptidifermentans]|uniref:Coat F domain-containing protein n=1 Tax=Alkaliphilus peptidifermentans DSM 18978 TaxID=1120976 RepID=A0A1G5JDW0_9FIRM|nr:spore coat protein [Alkaliphilus peptidifermentans]SCY86354.1 Coat F domain-containing protein [Alkaliphilus peptidifermentans DSM 18978]
MTSFFANRVKDNIDINDEVIANSMMASAATSAQAYLNASMAAPTPELKAMYSSSLNQVLVGHTSVSELAIKKGWEKPYDAPSEQLSDAYNKSKNTLS